MALKTMDSPDNFKAVLHGWEFTQPHSIRIHVAQTCQNFIVHWIIDGAYYCPDWRVGIDRSH